MRSAAVVLLSCLVVLAGCATPGGPVIEAPPSRIADGESGPVTPFSRLDRLDKAGPWANWAFHPTKPATRFRSVDAGGTRVVEAFADHSVSGLRHVLDVDTGQRPILEWRWRIDGTIDGADVGDRYADDSPVRIVLAFAGDASTLPLRDQMFFERVKLLSGQDMPYATLMYVWCNRRDPESINANAHTSRVKKIVVERGPDGVGQWRTYRRDIVADFERAYGAPPGRLVAIGVMSDSDNTKQVSRGWYGDIRLLPRTP